MGDGWGEGVDRDAGYRIDLGINHGGWARPVVLERYGVPGVTRVRSTREAASLLLSLPIVSRTRSQIEALMTFRSVLKGEASPGLARSDFIGAVLDAGYYVLPETFIELSAPNVSAAGQAVSDQSGLKEMFRELGRVSGLLLVKLVRRNGAHRGGPRRTVQAGGAPSQAVPF